MILTELLAKLGPCGLNCSKCFAFCDGSIQKLSSELKENLGNFDIYAERFQVLLNEPVFAIYPDFKIMLDHLSKAQCKGCRNDACKLFTACNVKQCSKDRSVDFCFQCIEFPCSKHGFDEHLEKRWLSIQNKMKEVGVESYFEEIKDTPRY
ncbi:MAG: hypothetical protein A2W99_05060 [Bacteroidetes bacterium GWF2_33_16]|nr:MAG: hypothetical protein A2X00_17580 [Bacteroidetes bacterium GWE2_32_14]OFY06035.1 MAG: hypothetical protein A2W99_05060 [Bacteroidetes bacterium GWF2_33_16]